jgi:acetolactate synthase regulatory subunit
LNLPVARHYGFSVTAMMVMNQRVKTNIILKDDRRFDLADQKLKRDIDLCDSRVEISEVRRAPHRNCKQTSVSLPTTDRERLLRLGADPSDADSLIGLFESHKFTLTEVAIRSFGRKSRLYKKALLDILFATARQAWSFDPQLMDAAEWVRRRSQIEARRLRKLWDARPVDCVAHEKAER